MLSICLPYFIHSPSLPRAEAPLRESRRIPFWSLRDLVIFFAGLYDFFSIKSPGSFLPLPCTLAYFADFTIFFDKVAGVLPLPCTLAYRAWTGRASMVRRGWWQSCVGAVSWRGGTAISPRLSQNPARTPWPFPDLAGGRVALVLSLGGVAPQFPRLGQNPGNPRAVGSVCGRIPVR